MELTLNRSNEEGLLLVTAGLLLVLHHLRNGYKFVSFTLVASQDAVTGFDAAAAVDADAVEFAVVQQDDVAAANLALRMATISLPTSASSPDR